MQKASVDTILNRIKNNITVYFEIITFNLGRPNEMIAGQERHYYEYNSETGVTTYINTGEVKDNIIYKLEHIQDGKLFIPHYNLFVDYDEMMRHFTLETVC